MANHRDIKPWLETFTRMSEYKGILYPKHFLKAGYPTIRIEFLSFAEWDRLMDLCESILIDDEGHRHFVWLNNDFFFTEEKHAQVFRSLLYMI